jgi:Ran GTPase-activating protein (RanGAP) involved in mRNA processing and transport
MQQPPPPVGLLAIARAHNAAADGGAPEGDLFTCLLPAGPAADAILRCLGFDGLGALMATCRAARREVAECARGTAWRDCKRKVDGYGTVWCIKAARLVAWAARFPNARALAVSRDLHGATGADIAVAVTCLRHLESLNLEYCGIGADGARALAGALQHVPRLKELDLSFNEICVDGARAIAAALQHVPGLERLNVSFNRLCNEGVSALSAALQYLPSLKTLDLTSCDIEAAGAAALAGALRHVPDLELLNVGLNSIGTDGACALASALHHVRSLEVLDVNYNYILDGGAADLARELFKHAPGLKLLKIVYRNGIESIGGKALKKLGKRLPNLEIEDFWEAAPERDRD